MTREYFYAVDGEGRLYHDKSELTDPKFLDFFFKRLKTNTTGRHPDYPYVSPCGKEMNYIRAELTPIVFHGHKNNELIYGASLKIPVARDGFSCDADFNLYHRAPTGHGRIATKLLLSWQSGLHFNDNQYTLLLTGFEEPFLIKPES